MTVTFFGHRDAPRTVYPLIEKTIARLIEKDSATSFYVGNNGGFDYMARIALQNLKAQYPYIEYSVVLAFKPRLSDMANLCCNVKYPECLQPVSNTAAIPVRNMWMIEKSDVVLAYVLHKKAVLKVCSVIKLKFQIILLQIMMRYVTIIWLIEI